MHALRLARAHTGREKFIKFEGHYHGMHDYVLFSTDSADVRAMGHRCSPIPAQTSSGIPRTLRDLVITLPFNDFEMLEKTVKREWFNIAAILFEPIMGNLASIEPKPGYLELIRKLCTDYGIVMIMDEVKTGFRIAPGGAQEVYSVIPDLATYAKSLANGFPLAAFGGKAEVMHTIVPGQVAHAGTYCGNPAGTAAADATLELLQDGKILKAIAERGKRLQRGISEALTRAGIPNLISGPPAMFGIILTNQKGIPDYRAFAKTERAFYEKIAMALVDRGVMPDPDNREPWFLCYSHTDQDIDDTLNRLEDAVRAVMKTTPFKFSAEAISD
jgi:glutamate-1-semialdehyde 2,1-aminomutase